MHLESIDDSCLPSISLGEDEASEAFTTRLYSYGESAMNGTDRSVKGELSHDHIVLQEVRRYLPICRQKANG